VSYEAEQIGGKVAYRGLQVFDRDIAAENARAMLRKGASIQDVAKAVGYARESSIRLLAKDYGFSELVAVRPPRWPSKDDPGDGEPSWRPKVKVGARRPPQAVAVITLPAFLPVRTTEVAPVTSPAEAAFAAGKEPHTPFSTPEILRQVAWKHHSNVAEIISEVRARYVVRARHEAMYRLRTERHLSWSQIGRVFNCDHTTALYGCRTHQARMERGQ